MALVVLGLRYFRPTTHRVEASTRQGEAQAERARKLGYSSPYLIGVLIALTNLASPTFLPSLIFAMSLLHSRGWVGHDVGANVLYAGGFGAGAALWFVLLLRTLTSLHSHLSPNFMQMISKVAGGLFLLFALMLTYSVVTATAWSRLPGWSWRW